MSALIITGGYGSDGLTAEVFVPSTGQHCQLPGIVERTGHTMEQLTVGGGYNVNILSNIPSNITMTSCFTLINGAWEKTTTLLSLGRYLSTD